MLGGLIFTAVSIDWCKPNSKFALYFFLYECDVVETWKRLDGIRVDPSRNPDVRDRTQYLLHHKTQNGGQISFYERSS